MRRLIPFTYTHTQIHVQQTHMDPCSYIHSPIFAVVILSAAVNLTGQDRAEQHIEPNLSYRLRR